MRFDVRKRDLQIYALLRRGFSRKEVAVKLNLTYWNICDAIERHDRDRRRKIRFENTDRREFPNSPKKNPLIPPA